MTDRTTDEPSPYEDAIAHFEGVGRLYYRRYHRLRPGKDEPMGSGRDSMDDDNLRQFQDWIKHEAFYDAIRRIDVLEAEIERGPCGGDMSKAVPIRWRSLGVRWDNVEHFLILMSSGKFTERWDHIEFATPWNYLKNATFDPSLRRPRSETGLPGARCPKCEEPRSPNNLEQQVLRLALKAAVKYLQPEIRKDVTLHGLPDTSVFNSEYCNDLADMRAGWGLLWPH